MQTKQVVASSWQLRIHEQNDPTHDLELLTVVFAVKYGDIISIEYSLSYSPKV